MKKAGAAVMGSAETSGQDRALRAAEQALLSPLLDNRDIMGAKKILLSIVSGDEAELQMDELTMITEYIQGQAGDECEVIFGHGLDSGLGEKIRVTVIATGFAQDDKHPVKKNEEKKVMDLEGPVETENKIVDNPVDDGDREIQLKESPEIKPVENSENEFSSDEISNEVEKSFFEETAEEENLLREPEAKLPEIPFEVDFTNVEDFPKRKDLPVEEKPYVYDLFSELENEPVAKFHEDEVKDIYNDEELFPDDDEFEMGKSESTDEIIDEEGLMKHRKTKERLELQRKERADKLTKARKQEMSKEEFNDKWHKAAYQRRGVKLESTPHSSDAFISRYNLNDDNNLLGNNKFLHDNVD
jgi:cell division protein FtsZ